MRRRLLLVLLLSPLLGAVLGVRIRAETPPLLATAIGRLVADEDRWAYTLTIQRFDKLGKPLGGPFVEHYDPSQPLRGQWTLETYDGHAPNGLERETWRLHKEHQMRQRDEKSLGEVLDLDHATLVNESASAATFLVPIMPGLSRRFPADELEVFMVVDKPTRTLRSFSLQPRGPFRVAGVLKVESAEARGRLDVVKPGFAPTFVWIKAAGVGRLFGLFKVGRGYEMRFSDFRRVRPYNERFEVKIGDIKALDF